MKNHSTKKGFIALMSAIIISFVLLASVISLGQQGILARFSLLTLTQKEESVLYAEACLEMAYVALRNNPTYTVSTRVISFEEGDCTFSVIEKNASDTDIFSRAHVDGATTNLHATVDTTGAVLLKEERATP